MPYQIKKLGNGQEEFHFGCQVITKALFGQFLNRDAKINK